MRISDWSSDVCSSDLSFSESLEKTLHNALKAASERQHEYVTLEHLLSALIDDEHAAEVMRACGVALEELQSDRKSVVYGRSGSVRVDLGGRRLIKTQKNQKTYCNVNTIS